MLEKLCLLRGYGGASGRPDVSDSTDSSSSSMFYYHQGGGLDGYGVVESINPFPPEAAECALSDDDDHDPIVAKCLNEIPRRNRMKVRMNGTRDIENSKCRPPLCARVRFDVSTVPTTETLAVAELRIFVDTKELHRAPSSRRVNPKDGAVSKNVVAKSRPGEDAYRLEIYEIMRPPSPNGEVISRLLDTKSLSTRHNGTWQTFDIHPALVRWKRGKEHNHGLEIKLVSKTPALSTDNHLRVRRSADQPIAQWALQRPVLVAFTNDGLTSGSPAKSSRSRLRRMRRSSNKNKRRKRRKNRKKRKRRKKIRKKHGNKNMCSVHKLYVDFDDVGWDDWIVAPPGYKANYCHGDCMTPLPIFTKASNHAMLQARVYAINEGSVPKVCCVPISMSVASMLYRDEKGRTVLKNYQDMTVERCGCK